MKRKTLNKIYSYNLKVCLKKPTILLALIIFLLSQVIFYGIVIFFLNGPSSNLIVHTLYQANYAIIVILFGVFVFTITNYLFNTQAKSGIISLEARVGIGSKTQFILRLAICLSVILPSLLVVALLNLALMFTTKIDREMFANYFLWSPYIFLIFYALIILPTIIISVRLFNSVISTAVLIVLALLTSLSPMLHYYANLTNPREHEVGSFLSLNVRLKYAKGFYETFKEDKSIKQFFEDENSEEQSVFLNQIFF